MVLLWWKVLLLSSRFQGYKPYRLIFCSWFLLVRFKDGACLDLADAFNGLMAIPNHRFTCSSGVVVSETREFQKFGSRGREAFRTLFYCSRISAAVGESKIKDSFECYGKEGCFDHGERKKRSINLLSESFRHRYGLCYLLVWVWVWGAWSGVLQISYNKEPSLILMRIPVPVDAATGLAQWMQLSGSGTSKVA